MRPGASIHPDEGTGPRTRRGTALLAGVWLLLGGWLGLTSTPARAASQPPSFRLPEGPLDPWVAYGPEAAWNGLASSADGRLLAATARDDCIHTSSDYGRTWTPRGEARAWRGIASSADGQRLVAVVEGGRIHTSADAGANWTERETPRKWSAVACSSHGLWLAATVDGGRIHTSTNGGVTWTEGASVRAWSAIASSADGWKLAATVYDGPIHVSTDAGRTWAASGPEKLWKAIASSADGTRLAAAVWHGRVNTSTNSALSWTEWDSNPYGLGGRLHRWRAIACPADGGMFMAADELLPEAWAGRGRVAVSRDFGPTWEEQGRRLDWAALVCSADGRRWVAAAEGNRIHSRVEDRWSVAPGIGDGSGRGRIHTHFRTTSRYTLEAHTNSGPVVLPRFATEIVPGVREGVSRRIEFRTATDDPSLFLAPPRIRSDGTLEFTPGGRPGRTVVSVVARNEGGMGEGGPEAGAEQTFWIHVQNRVFVASPWNGDADTGISGSSTLWAYRFAPATNEPAIVNGVRLPAAGGSTPSIPGRFSLRGSSMSDPGYNFLTLSGGEGSARMGGRWVNGFHGMELALEGLLPGRPYAVHVYCVSAEPGPIPGVWSAGSDAEATELDESRFGRGRGVRVTHAFVPSEPTYRITLAPVIETRWNFNGLALNSVPATALLEQPASTLLAPGDARDLGAQPLGAGTRLVFTVRNLGVVPLSDLTFTTSGPHPDDFEIIDRPTKPIPGSGGTGTFTVDFSPLDLGRRSAVLHVASNDPRLLSVPLSGTGLPEDAVLVRDIPDQVIDEDGRTDALPFDLGELAAGDPPSLIAKSSEPALVPNANILLEGVGSRRRVTVVPAPDRFGSALIRIRSQVAGRNACRIFRVTVNPVNDPPRFGIPDGTPIPVGTEWTTRERPREWREMASSHDGRRLAAIVHPGRIHTSTNTGASWTARDEVRAWTSMAGSADGLRLVASVRAGLIYVSSDGGATWLPVGTRRDWTAVASSADGVRLVAAAEGGQIYTSTEAGRTWVARERNREWRALASSADGHQLVAAVHGGLLFVSRDAGETWSARGEPRAWTGVASSADGRRLVATAYDGPILVSGDAGATWEPRGGERFWHAVACSADGQFLAASETLGPVFLSNDFGATWKPHGEARDHGGLVLSGDGRVLVASLRSGPLLVSESRIEPYTLAVGANSGPSVTTRFLVGLASGPTNEAGQSVRLRVTHDNPGLFRIPPAIDAHGTLAFAPAGHPGSALVTLSAHDDGGLDRGGRDGSEPRTFRLVVNGSGFSHGPWTDDASSQIHPAATLWAYRFGASSSNEIAIRGVPVPLVGGPRPHVPDRFALLGQNGASVDVNSLSPIQGGASLAGGFVGGGQPSTLVLEGLVPGTPYTLLCFSVGARQTTPRRVSWESGADVATVDQQAYGVAHGIRLAYSFTADASNRVIVARPVSRDDWRFYGLALNAIPRVGTGLPAGTDVANPPTSP